MPVNKRDDSGNSQIDRSNNICHDNKDITIETDACNLEENVDYCDNGIDISDRHDTKEIEMTTSAL